jgi:mono/diheme cytochrome c family protein
VPNPYRDNTSVMPAGEAAYERYCAECHGERSARPIAEGPDLRRLNSFCKRLADAALRQRCLADVDRYFLNSVLEGKLRAGLMHMPAWQGVLPQETIWAIRSFTETRPLPPPRTLPDLPPVGR